MHDRRDKQHRGEAVVGVEVLESAQVVEQDGAEVFDLAQHFTECVPLSGTGRPVLAGIADGLGLWKLVEQVGSILVLTLIFSLVLRWLPPVPPGFRAAAGGAIVASLLLSGLRNLMNLYFENAGVTSLYGAAVTLVVVLLWIYFSVQIFFIGAETAGFLQRKWSPVPQGSGEAV